MAKKHINKKKNQKTIWKKLVASPWYLKLIVLVALIFVLFSTFKFCMNTYNISLLNKAEEKMRALDLPKADHTMYRRSCSFRSVKFGGAGSPTCHAQRVDSYSGRTVNQAMLSTENLFNSFKGSFGVTADEISRELEGIEVKITKSIDSVPRLELQSYQKGLTCDIATRLDKKSSSAPEGEYRIITSCHRRFMFQAYPEI